MKTIQAQEAPGCDKNIITNSIENDEQVQEDPGLKGKGEDKNAPQPPI